MTKTAKRLKKVKWGIDAAYPSCYDVGMPNQRATNKKQFTAAFDKAELAAIDNEARKLGITRTEFLRMAAMKEVRRMLEERRMKEERTP